MFECARWIHVAVAIVALTIAMAGFPETARADSRQAMTAGQRSAFERGRAYQRIVFVLQDPSVCFVAALRPRIEADLAEFEDEPETASAGAAKSTSAYDTLRSFLRTGNENDLSPDLAGADYFEPFLAKDAPHSASRWWLVEAGMAETELRGSIGDPVRQMMAGMHAEWLGNHLGDSGQFSTIVPLSDLKGKKLPAIQSIASIAASLSASPQPEAATADFNELTKYDVDLVRNLDKAFPEPAYPAISYPDGLLGDARLGVAWATIGELAQEPRFLWQPETQSFIDDFFRQLRQTLNDSKSDQALTDARLVLSVGSIPQQQDVVDHLGPGIARLLYGHLPSARTDVIFLGFDAAQANWQVAARDSDEAKYDRDWVAGHASLDPFVPGLDKLRQGLGEVKPGDWPNLIDKAQGVVAAILSDPNGASTN